jgi:hypothetical protein
MEFKLSEHYFQDFGWTQPDAKNMGFWSLCVNTSGNGTMTRSDTAIGRAMIGLLTARIQ